VNDLFDQYPKVRPILPKVYTEIYSSHYESNRKGYTPASSLSQRMEIWMHKEVAKDVIDQNEIKSTLEIGAGTLNQIKYESEVGPYDIVEPFKALFEGSTLVRRIRHIYSDISMIPNNHKYDRITSVATFEHICNLPKVIAKCGILLQPSGALRVAIPNEGRLLWTLSWKLTTGLEFKIKYGLDYGLLMSHEHVNQALEIEELLDYFFRDISCKFLGMTKSLSFYQFYMCKSPRMSRCHGCLSSMN
jgi:hypothetical protein|tara:strand:- start:1540 stop:2277 length:738 start_codon:yes stop_codon:yes gene_type:complete